MSAEKVGNARPEGTTDKPDFAIYTNLLMEWVVFSKSFSLNLSLGPLQTWSWAVVVNVDRSTLLVRLINQIYLKGNLLGFCYWEDNAVLFECNVAGSQTK